MLCADIPGTTCAISWAVPRRPGQVIRPPFREATVLELLIDSVPPLGRIQKLPKSCNIAEIPRPKAKLKMLEIHPRAAMGAYFGLLIEGAALRCSDRL